MIPQGFIQDLLARADIVDVVGQVVPLKKAGINYKGLCPFHGEKSASFIVSPSRQTYHCFGCGAHGNAVGFLMEHSGLGFIEAIRELAGDLGVAVPEEDSTPEDRARAAQARERQLTLTELLAKAGQHYRQQLKVSPRAIDYLKRRGLSGEIAARFGLGYAPGGSHALASCFAQYDDPQLVEAGLVILREGDGQGQEARRYDRFRDRIMFPIRNPKGEVIGFGARVIDQGEPKYLNSPETPVFVKGRELYGLYEGRVGIRQRGYVLVTEGYMDVVALAQWGFPNAVATLGTACTGDHVAKLLRFSEQVVFSFDGDAAGRRAAARALEAVLPHATDTRGFRFLFLPAEHDPDSFIREQGTEAFEACVSQALPLSRQLIAVASEGCDLATPEGRARMLAQARPLMEQLPDGLLREQLLAELAREGGLSPQVLLNHWQGQGSSSRAGARGEARHDPRSAARTGDPNQTGHAPTASRGNPAGADPAEPPSWFDEPGVPMDDGGWAGWEPHMPAAHEAGQPPGGFGSRRADPGGRGAGQGPVQGQGKNWGAGKGSRSWNGKGGGRWRDRDEAPWPRLPPPRTATPLDRAAWLLVHDAQLWLHLSADIHELLARQPSPYAEFFSGIDRIVHDQGPLPMATLLADLLMAQDPGAPDPSLKLLVERVRGLHEFNESGDPSAELSGVLHQLRLQAVNDEISLLSESGDLSEDARQRHRRLLEELRSLKAGPPNDDAQ